MESIKEANTKTLVNDMISRRKREIALCSIELKELKEAKVVQSNLQLDSEELKVFTKALQGEIDSNKAKIKRLIGDVLKLSRTEEEACL